MICNVFRDYKSISEVILYGSRALETNRNFSDIDLTVKGNNITHDEMCEISRRLDDLLLPYEIDLSVFSELKNKNLINHIMRVGKTIYTSEKAANTQE